jgi:hypothetical protein
MRGQQRNSPLAVLTAAVAAAILTGARWLTPRQILDRSMAVPV